MRSALPRLLALALAALPLPASPSGTLIFDCAFPSAGAAADTARPAEHLRFLLDSGRRKAYRETARGNVEVMYRVDQRDTAVVFIEEGGTVTRVDAAWSSTRNAGGVVRSGDCRVR